MTTGSKKTHRHEGQVFKKALGHYYVRTTHQTVVCSLSSKLRKDLVYPTADRSSVGHRRVQAVRGLAVLDPVAIGDWVEYLDAPHGTGMIMNVLPRTNRFVRPAAGTQEIEQVIAANIDQLIPMLAAARPEPTWGLLDRYLAIAEAEDLPVLICITKIDLVEPGLIDAEAEIYRRMGYPVILTSVRSGSGVEALQAALHDRLSVFVGKSGVGKTSLLNTIQPGLGLRVNEISESTGKGKHTTTHLEMFDLDGGGQVIDTPGVKELSLASLADYDLAYLFREMRPYLGQCQFGATCTHSHEPGCAIKAAVTAGDIAERRYQSYLRMDAE
jgi:ribosome biogenesis GTPase